MTGEVNAVVGDTTLRKVVGANFLRTVSRAHHSAALFRDGLVLLLKLQVVEACLENTQSLCLILVPYTIANE